jgi:hypothetical protein
MEAYELLFAASMELDFDDAELASVLATEMVRTANVSPYLALVFLSNNGRATVIPGAANDPELIDLLTATVVPEVDTLGGAGFKFNVVWFALDTDDVPSIFVAFGGSPNAIHKINLRTKEITIHERPAR